MAEVFIPEIAESLQAHRALYRAWVVLRRYQSVETDVGIC